MTYIPVLPTYTGKSFNPLEPKAEDIVLEDIAHALGMLCRYCGHVNRFYSVAEHCIVMSLMVVPELRLYALLHDAAEAYMADLPHSVKCSLPSYKEMEIRVESAVYEALGVGEPTAEIEAEVKIADRRIAATERDQFFTLPIRGKAWEQALEPFSFILRSWTPPEATKRYEERFEELVRGDYGIFYARKTKGESR